LPVERFFELQRCAAHFMQSEDARGPGEVVHLHAHRIDRGARIRAAAGASPAPRDFIDPRSQLGFEIALENVQPLLQL
jgi:hypothetical protein